MKAFALEQIKFNLEGEFTEEYSVEPLISGRRQEKGKWALKRGWPFNRVHKRLP